MTSGANKYTCALEYTYWHDLVDTWYRGEARKLVGQECENQYEYLMWTEDDEWVAAEPEPKAIAEQEEEAGEAATEEVEGADQIL